MVKKIFDALYPRRAEIEQAVGAAGTVSWEPLDETAKRASRVAIYHPGNVYDEPEIVPAPERANQMIFSLESERLVDLATLLPIDAG